MKSEMNFKAYLNAAYTQLATDPKNVAEGIKQHFNLMESDDDVMEIARLIVLVYGEYLGEWNKGIELLRKLKNNAKIKDQQEMKRLVTILTLGNNPNTSIDDFSLSDRAIIYAQSAAALARLGGLRNAEKFLKLSVELTTTQLTKEDPAQPELAEASSRIVEFMKTKTERSEMEEGLLKLAQAHQ